MSVSPLRTANLRVPGKSSLYENGSSSIFKGPHLQPTMHTKRTQVFYAQEFYQTEHCTNRKDMSLLLYTLMSSAVQNGQQNKWLLVYKTENCLRSVALNSQGPFYFLLYTL